MAKDEMEKADSVIAEANRPILDRDGAMGIASFADAISILEDSGIKIEDSVDYTSDGFDFLENKGLIVGVPFVIMDWRFHDGQWGAGVSCRIVTERGQRFTFVDFGVGIPKQLETVRDDRIKRGIAPAQAGLMCKRGLRESSYDVTDSKGNEVGATTYYIA